MTDKTLEAQPDEVPSDVREFPAERIQEVMRMMQADCAQDAKLTDGMAIDGKNLGYLFGSILACVDSLAKACEALAGEVARLGEAS